MNKNRVPLYLVVAAIACTSLAWNPQQDGRRDIQAVVVKLVRDVKKKGPTRAWEQTIRGDRLRSGHQIRTEERSLALVVFPDKSKLIIREKSVVEIKGAKERGQIVDRSVHVDRGKLAFRVQKQKEEQFRFSSPISVASIRGTGGGVEHDVSDTTSTFVCTEGSYDVDGNTLITGQTYERHGEGQGTVRDSTPEDEQLGSDSEDVEGDDQDDQQQQGQSQQQGQQQRNRLELIGRDASGKEVKVIIE